MEGLGVVTLGAVDVFGLVVPLSDGFRLRVNAREWGTLNFAEGQTLSAKLPDGSGLAVFVASVVTPPGTGQTWVTLTRPVGEGFRPAMAS